MEDGQPNENTNFCSAFIWAGRAESPFKQQLGEEIGGVLSEAIRKCVSFDFSRDVNLGNPWLVELVYSEVVVPLEKVLPAVLNVQTHVHRSIELWATR